MKNKYISLSEKNLTSNYNATICRIDSIEPIPNADNLVKSVINGFDIVISKEMQIGDIVVYCPVESCLSEKFLSINNLYEIGERDKNINYNEVQELINKLEDKKDIDKSLYEEEKKNIRKLCGFFNRYGRVRCISLRKQPSQGFITPWESIVKAYPEIKEIDPEVLIGTVFDTICGDQFITKFIPPIKENNHHGNKSNKKYKKLHKFDRIIPEQFAFHYDTAMLQNNIFKINPDDILTISQKRHGTSGIFANILCKRKLTIWEKIQAFFGKKINQEEYGNVYASRSVIKNQYINPNACSFYDMDIWGWANDILKPYITEGMTIYAEIYGYLPNSESFIQKFHNYTCVPFTNRSTLIMPYRITETDADGNKKEWQLTDVQQWTIDLISKNPELSDKLDPVNILYHGTLEYLYSDIDTSQHWHENVLARLKTEKMFGMEEEDPLCKTFNISKKEKFHAPIEGIVIRKDEDAEKNISEAWKLKCQKHYLMETQMLDNGEVDIETIESEGEN